MNFLEKKREILNSVLERSEGERDIKNKRFKHRKFYFVEKKWMQPSSKTLLPKMDLHNIEIF